jgi:hypothetical protein
MGSEFVNGVSEMSTYSHPSRYDTARPSGPVQLPSPSENSSTLGGSPGTPTRAARTRQEGSQRTS